MTDPGGRSPIHAVQMKSSPVPVRSPDREMDCLSPLFPRSQRFLRLSRVARVLHIRAGYQIEYLAERLLEVVPLLHKRVRADHPGIEGRPAHPADEMQQPQ